MLLIPSAAIYRQYTITVIGHLGVRTHSIHPSEIALEARIKTVEPFRTEKRALHS